VDKAKPFKIPKREVWEVSLPKIISARSDDVGDLEPELEQFTMDARGAPQWVLLAHPVG
jgi:hypothetical protein